MVGRTLVEHTVLDNTTLLPREIILYPDDCKAMSGTPRPRLREWHIQNGGLCKATGENAPVS